MNDSGDKPRIRVLLAAHGEAETAGFLDNFRVSWHTLTHAAEVMRLPAPLRVLIGTFAGLRKRFGAGSGSPHNENTRKQASALEARLNADGGSRYRVDPVFASAPTYLDDALDLPTGVDRQMIVNMIPTDSRLSCGLGCHRLMGGSESARAFTQVIARFWESPELIVVHRDHIMEHFPTQRSRQNSCLVLVLHGTVVRDETGQAPGYHTGESEKTAYADALKAALVALPERPWQRVEIAYLNHGVGGEWSSPTLPELLTRLAADGVDSVVAYACEHLVDGGETVGLLRTLDAAPVFDSACLPCLNASPRFMDMLAACVHDADELHNVALTCDRCPLRDPPTLPRA